MKRRKLNYRFHNPNPAVATADYLLKLFLEAKQGKVQLAMQAAANQVDDTEKKSDEGRPT